MLLTISHSTAYQKVAVPLTPFGKINLTELHHVHRDHLLSSVIKLASVTELERRATELCRDIPHFAEEAAIVVHEEKTRHLRLTASPLHITL